LILSLHFHASDSTGYTIQVDVSHLSTTQSSDNKEDVERSAKTQDYQPRGAQDRGEMVEDGEDQLERSGWQGGSSVDLEGGSKLMSRGYGNVLIDPLGLKRVLIVCSLFHFVRWADE
jgi:hypothetical protein